MKDGKLQIHAHRDTSSPNINHSIPAMMLAFRNMNISADAAALRALNTFIPQAPAQISAAVPFTLTGPGTKWEVVSIAFHGPMADAADNQPSPFLNYRLQLAFTAPGGRTYNLPGFLDGDGQGDRRGNVCRVLFSPDEAGSWNGGCWIKGGTPFSC